MPAKQPICEKVISGGLSFVNNLPNSNYRVLRLDSNDGHLYWESVYQNILRLNKDFSDFFPNVDFSDNGNQVTFTKHINGVEVLSQSRPMRHGESINRSEWDRFLNSWHGFKALAEQPDVPEDISRFIKSFRPPSFDIFPSAFRIYKPHWYSKPQLFILWGLEPASASDIPNVYDDVDVISQNEEHVEPVASQISLNFKRLIKFLLLGLAALILLLTILWLLIPTPVADFNVIPKVGKSIPITNTTRFTTLNSNYGVTSYDWLIEKGSPTESSEFEPVVTWKLPGASNVKLEATRSILGGLLYKRDQKTKVINVTTETLEPESQSNKYSPGPKNNEVEKNPKNEPNLSDPKSLPENPSEDEKATNPKSLYPSKTPEVLPRNPFDVDPLELQKDKSLEKSEKSDKDNDLYEKNVAPNDNEKNPKLQPLDEKGFKTGDSVKDLEPLPHGKYDDKNKSPRVPYPKPKLNEDSQQIPKISIINQSIIPDGTESQKIEFSVESQVSVELTTITIDGSDINIRNKSKNFVSILKKGIHRLELTYTNSDGNSDIIVQEINVDSRPDNRLTPPIKKIKPSDLESPEVPQQEKQQENFNKKLA